MANFSEYKWKWPTTIPIKEMPMLSPELMKLIAIEIADKMGYINAANPEETEGLEAYPYVANIAQEYHHHSQRLSLDFRIEVILPSSNGHPSGEPSLYRHNNGLNHYYSQPSYPPIRRSKEYRPINSISVGTSAKWFPII